MKSIDEAEAQARLDEVLEESQRQPIVITRQGRDTAVVVSATDYERLRVANIVDIFVEDSWRRVYAGELEVRPPGAPTTD